MHITIIPVKMTKKRLQIETSQVTLPKMPGRTKRANHKPFLDACSKWADDLIEGKDIQEHFATGICLWMSIANPGDYLLVGPFVLVMNHSEPVGATLSVKTEVRCNVVGLNDLKAYEPSDDYDDDWEEEEEEEEDEYDFGIDEEDEEDDLPPLPPKGKPKPVHKKSMSKKTTPKKQKTK